LRYDSIINYTKVVWCISSWCESRIHCSTF